MKKIIILLFCNSVFSQCLTNVSISTSNYSTVLTESSTYIKINSSVASAIKVKLDANPNSGYVEMKPGFIAFPTLDGEFIAQALDGCGILIPSKNNLEDSVINSAFSDLNISLYPNPTIDKVNISFNSLNDLLYDFQIFDINGKLILEKRIKPDEKNCLIDLTALQSNVYIYKLKSGTTIKEGRIIKRQ